MNTPLLAELLPTFSHLKDQKNLLAFSAGVDSTALFFLLLEASIPFDIAIVHYHRRPQADKEVAYAQELAKRYNKQCFIAHATLDDTNFESMARKFRYDFFEELIDTHSYTTLLTAHQLDDRFEWMMMQFCKGAGCAELAGMKMISPKKNYSLIRPILEISKNKLLNYLTSNKITYFFDESNADPKHTRNSFRPLLEPLMQKYEQGIKKSFTYIQKDLATFTEPSVRSLKEMTYFKTADETTTLRTLATLLKERGTLLSQGQREEIIRQKECVIGDKWVIIYDHSFTLISPFVKEPMPKKFKEACRQKGLPKLIRSYLFSAQISPDELHHALHHLP